MKPLALLAGALVACTPPATHPAEAASPPAPAQADAGAPDPIALRICLDNFEQLNPCRPDTSCLTEAQIQSVFCNTPEDLAPWVRQEVISGVH